MFWTGLGIGIVIGVTAGVVTMALCIAAKDNKDGIADDK